MLLCGWGDEVTLNTIRDFIFGIIAFYLGSRDIISNIRTRLDNIITGLKSHVSYSYIVLGNALVLFPNFAAVCNRVETPNFCTTAHQIQNQPQAVKHYCTSNVNSFRWR